MSRTTEPTRRQLMRLFADAPLLPLSSAMTAAGLALAAFGSSPEAGTQAKPPQPH